jgi:integrase
VTVTTPLQRHAPGRGIEAPVHIRGDTWHRPIADVTAPELLEILADLQARIPESASRVRQRLDAIFEDAQFHGWCAGNPAASLKRKLREGKARRERGHHAAMPYPDLPAFQGRLRAMAGTAVRCLEFTILTGARTIEALGARWSEVNLRDRTWLVPANRMKCSVRAMRSIARSAWTSEKVR